MAQSHTPRNGSGRAGVDRHAKDVFTSELKVEPVDYIDARGPGGVRKAEWLIDKLVRDHDLGVADVDRRPAGRALQEVHRAVKIKAEADRALDDAKSKAVCIQKRAQAALALAENIAEGRRLIVSLSG